jgi:molecular chaperone DnaK (HSP70)
MKIGLSSYINEPGATVEETCYRLPSVNMEKVPSTADELCATIILETFRLTLEEYDLAVNHLYKRSILPVQRLLQDLNLQKEEIDEVVMVGGTTRMPQVRELVRKELDKERLNTHIDPDLTVAYGAASVLD